MNCDELMEKCREELRARYGGAPGVTVLCEKATDRRGWVCTAGVSRKGADGWAVFVFACGPTKGRAAARLARLLGVAWEAGATVEGLAR